MVAKKWLSQVIPAAKIDGYNLNETVETIYIN